MEIRLPKCGTILDCMLYTMLRKARIVSNIISHQEHRSFARRHPSCSTDGITDDSIERVAESAPLGN